MPKGLPKSVKDSLDKCQACAIASVDVYNRPGPRFRTAQFIVLMTMAWTALFHAVFFKRGKNPWHKKPGKNRYLRVDGEPKHWELIECIKQFYGANNPPERKNLEFLIGLRNKIEHRHLPELDPGLYGECQASLMNLEDLLESEFGSKYALTEQLAVALQFTRVIPKEKRKATKLAASKAASSIREYVENFRSGLSPTVLNSSNYSFSVYLVPKIANRKELADVAVEFIRMDSQNPVDYDRLEKLNVLIKEKHIPIANLNLYKPGEVVLQVNQLSKNKLTSNKHAAAWKYFKVRPNPGSLKPEITNSQYCVYDPAHKDYLYTQSWVEKLINEFVLDENYSKITKYIKAA